MSCPANDFEYRLPWIIPLEERSIPQTTSSFTALAFAPGVLKTTIPLFVASSTGILLVPAPALPMHFNDALKSSLLSI